MELNAEILEPKHNVFVLTEQSGILTKKVAVNLKNVDLTEIVRLWLVVQ